MGAQGRRNTESSSWTDVFVTIPHMSWSLFPEALTEARLATRLKTPARKQGFLAYTKDVSLM